MIGRRSGPGSQLAAAAVVPRASIPVQGRGPAAAANQRADRVLRALSESGLIVWF